MKYNTKEIFNMIDEMETSGMMVGEENTNNLLFRLFAQYAGHFGYIVNCIIKPIEHETSYGSVVPKLLIYRNWDIDYDHALVFHIAPDTFKGHGMIETFRLLSGHLFDRMYFDSTGDSMDLFSL